jgi:hypothetical protein
VNERRLAEAAEAGAAALTDAEQRHVTACERCGRLFEGHRRAVHLLSGPWQRVDTRRATFLMWRRGNVARWAQLASAVAIGVALTAALLYWRQSSTPAVSASASPSDIPTAPTVFSSPLPTGTALAKGTPFSTPSSASTFLDLAAAIRRNVPLPAGAQVDTNRLVADSDWLVMGISFPGSTTTEALYAANLHTGALRKIRDAAVSSVPLDISVAGSQAAWADVTCQSSMPSPMPTEQAHPQVQVHCSSWRVILTDLDTGASRVVAQGSNPEIVNEAISQDTPVPVVPTVALGDDVLAYTTGDLTHGLKLNLLTLSSGATRTLPLGGPVEGMRWAGGDLAWVEDPDLQPAGTNGSAYPSYSGSHLMLLPKGASEARWIADGAYWPAAATGEITWDTGGCEMWTASAPGWQPVDTGYEGCPPFVSGGWLGWGVGYKNASFLILGPSDSEPRGVPDGVALTGGWLILLSQPDQQAKLEVVRVSDLK